MMLCLYYMSLTEHLRDLGPHRRPRRTARRRADRASRPRRRLRGGQAGRSRRRGGRQRRRRRRHRPGLQTRRQSVRVGRPRRCLHLDLDGHGATQSGGRRPQRGPVLATQVPLEEGAAEGALLELLAVGAERRPPAVGRGPHLPLEADVRRPPADRRLPPHEGAAVADRRHGVLPRAVPAPSPRVLHVGHDRSVRSVSLMLLLIFWLLCRD